LVKRQITLQSVLREPGDVGKELLHRHEAYRFGPFFGGRETMPIDASHLVFMVDTLAASGRSVK